MEEQYQLLLKAELIFWGLLFCFETRVFLCWLFSGCPGTCPVDQVGLELRDPSVGIKGMCNHIRHFLTYNLRWLLHFHNLRWQLWCHITITQHSGKWGGRFVNSRAAWPIQGDLSQTPKPPCPPGKMHNKMHSFLCTVLWVWIGPQVR